MNATTELTLFMFPCSTGHVDIDAASGLAYEYTLSVDGKSLKKFVENKENTSKAWTCQIVGVDTRIVLG